MIEATHRHVLSITELAQQTRSLLENHFPSIWVTGEISNFVTPSSGHWYFSLKDARSQIRCVLFRPQNHRVTFIPEQGQQVLIQATASLYGGRGDFQLIAQHMELCGDGLLQRQFEQLKSKLAKEGLFAEKHKKTIPTIPQKIGVITSPTGAAIKDIISVLKRRFPALPLIIYPTVVQGNTAAAQIVNALTVAKQRNECDVLIIARGGGSLEDLWPFNEEAVARAIYAHPIPIISGIGHEIDITIADFVADYRAATPSAAAESASLNQATLLDQFTQLSQQLFNPINYHLNTLKKTIEHLQKRLTQRHPQMQLQQLNQHIDQLEKQLLAQMNTHLFKIRLRLESLTSKHSHLHPRLMLQTLNTKLTLYKERINHLMDKKLETKKAALTMASLSLDIISPLATLSRGYAILTDQKNNVIHNTHLLNPGETIKAKVEQGAFECLIQTIYPEK